MESALLSDGEEIELPAKESHSVDDEEVVDEVKDEDDESPLNHQTYHTFDFDQMERRLPFLSGALAQNVKSFQLLLDQHFCATFTYLECFLQMAQLCDDEVLRRAQEEYSRKAESSAGNTEIRQFLLHHICCVARRQAIHLNMEELQGQTPSLFRDPTFAWEVKIFAGCIIAAIPLQQLIDQTFIAATEQSAVSESLSKSYLMQDKSTENANDNRDNSCIHARSLAEGEIADFPMECDLEEDDINAGENFTGTSSKGTNSARSSSILSMSPYFMPKVQCLLSSLFNILQKTSANNFPYDIWEMKPKKPFCFQLPVQDWAQRIAHALRVKDPQHVMMPADGAMAQKTNLSGKGIGMAATIVFCNKKVLAFALRELCNAIWKRQGYVITADLLTGDVPPEMQRRVLKMFKRDKVNVIFATEVAEEGLDIKQCSSIINFDGPQSVKAFIQRRGRARGENSLIVSLLPSLSTNKKSYLHQFRDLKSFLIRERRIDEQFIFYTQSLISKRQNSVVEKYQVPSTGAYVNFVSAQALVFEFCQSLRTSNEIFASSSTYIQTLPFYTFESYTDAIMDEIVYNCSLHLPKQLHFPVFSWTSNKKMQGKGRAAIEAVRFLHAKGLLDNHLRVLRHLNKSDSLSDNASDSIKKEDSSEDKVNMSLKVVPDELTCEPPIRRSLLLTDAEESFMTLQFYGIAAYQQQEVSTASTSQSKPSSTKKTNKCPSTVLNFDFLTALNSTCFAVANIKEQDIDESVFQGFYKGMSDLKFRFVYLGGRNVTKREVAVMQAFHRAIFSLEVPEVNGHLRECHGFYNLRKFCSAFFNSNEGLPGLDFPYYDANTWTTSSNGAWYIVFPSQVDLRSLWQSKLDCTTVSSTSKINSVVGIEDVYNADFILHHALEAIAFVNNLHIMRQNATIVEATNKHKQSSVVAQANYVSQHHTREGFNQFQDFVRSDNDPLKTEMQETMLLTTNGVSLFRVDTRLNQGTAESESQVLLTDVMDKKKNITFKEYYSKRGPNSAAWIAARVNELALWKKDHSKSSPIAILDADKARTAGNTNMIAEHSSLNVVTPGFQLSGKLVLMNLLSRELQHIGQPSRQYFVLKFAHPVGRIMHYYQALCLPALAFRFQAVMLAREVRSVLYQRMLVFRTDNQLDDNRVDDHYVDLDVKKGTNDGVADYYCRQGQHFAIDKLPILSTLLESITTSRALEGIQSERMEYLGDSFLKFASTIYVYNKYPNASEGQLTTCRRSIISNKSLTELALSTGLGQYIRAIPFSRGLDEVLFQPPGYGVTPVGSESTIFLPSLRNQNIQLSVERQLLQHDDKRTKKVEAKNRTTEDVAVDLPIAAVTVESEDREVTPPEEVLNSIQELAVSYRYGRDQRQELRGMPDKLLADIMEAILGACYLHGGEELGFLSLATMGILDEDLSVWWKSEDSKICLLNIQSATSNIEDIPKYIMKRVNASSPLNKLRPAPNTYLPLPKRSLQAIESILQYHFLHPSYLAVALTHASIPAMDVTSYERLEFLGDAVMDFIVARELYRLNDGWDEGHLSQAKHDHTNNQYLGRIAVRLGIIEHLRHHSSGISTLLNVNQDSESDEDEGDLEETIVGESQDMLIETIDQGDQRLHHSETGDNTLVCPVGSTSSLQQHRSSSARSSYLQHKKIRQRNNLAKETVDECGEVPKIHADVFEAIIGAVYLDSGGSLSIVEQLLRRTGVMGNRMCIKPNFVSQSCNNQASPSSLDAKKVLPTETVEMMASHSGRVSNQRIPQHGAPGAALSVAIEMASDADTNMAKPVEKSTIGTVRTYDDINDQQEKTSEKHSYHDSACMDVVLDEDSSQRFDASTPLPTAKRVKRSPPPEDGSYHVSFR